MKIHHGGTDTRRSRKLRVLLCIILLLSSCASATTTEAIPATDFNLQSLNGEQTQLADLRGRWVVINFWATWCAPCVEELPLLQQLAEQHPNALAVLAINMREDEDAVRAFVEQHNLSLPVLLEPDDQMLLDYGVQGLPLSIMVSPNGEVMQRHVGPVDKAFETWLEQAMAKTEGQRICRPSVFHNVTVTAPPRSPTCPV